MEITKDIPIKLPKRALTNIDLKKFAKLLEIHNFRGVFMKDSLPKSGAKVNETGLINLDDQKGNGTHWTAYKKINNQVIYFNSFGNLPPPTELVKYLNKNNKCEIIYNHQTLQKFDTVICGHLCLKFLYNYNN
jgi:hypothetical protein